MLWRKQQAHTGTRIRQWAAVSRASVSCGWGRQGPELSRTDGARPQRMRVWSGGRHGRLVGMSASASFSSAAGWSGPFMVHRPPEGCPLLPPRSELGLRMPVAGKDGRGPERRAPGDQPGGTSLGAALGPCTRPCGPVRAGPTRRGRRRHTWAFGLWGAELAGRG